MLRCTSQNFDGSRRPSGVSQATTCTACGPLTTCKNTEIGGGQLACWGKLGLCGLLLHGGLALQNWWAGQAPFEPWGRSQNSFLVAIYATHVSTQHPRLFTEATKCDIFDVAPFSKLESQCHRSSGLSCTKLINWYLCRHMPLWERSEGGIFVGERGAGSGHGDSNACKVCRSHFLRIREEHLMKRIDSWWKVFVESLIFLGFQLIFSEFKILKPEAMRLHVDQCLWSNVGMPCINCVQSDDSFQRIKCWLACLRRPQLVWFQAVCHLALVVCSVSSIIFAPPHRPFWFFCFRTKKKARKAQNPGWCRQRQGFTTVTFGIFFCEWRFFRFAIRGAIFCPPLTPEEVPSGWHLNIWVMKLWTWYDSWVITYPSHCKEFSMHFVFNDVWTTARCRQEAFLSRAKTARNAQRVIPMGAECRVRSSMILCFGDKVALVGPGDVWVRILVSNRTCFWVYPSNYIKSLFLNKGVF